MIQPIIEYLGTLLILQRDTWAIIKIFMQYKIIYGIVHIDYDEVLVRKENSSRGHSQRCYVPPMKSLFFAIYYKKVEHALYQTVLLPLLFESNIDLFISNYYKHS